MNKPITYENWTTHHFILYAKGHYKRSNDTLEDLRTLLSNATGTPKEFYSDILIYFFLARSCSECLTRRNLAELLECFYHKPFYIGEGPTTLPEMIDCMLGLMACIQIREQDDYKNWYDLVDLGEPRADYLPLTAEGERADEHS